MRNLTDARLTEAQQKIIYDAGFSIAYVNHTNGWETHYNWKRTEEFKPHDGWRVIHDHTSIDTAN